MAKLKPKGFIAICQCENIVGAMDYESTERKDAGKLLGEWIHNGCTIKPMFLSSWSASVKPCECESGKAKEKEHQTNKTEHQIRVDGKPIYWPYGINNDALEKFVTLCEVHPDCYVDIAIVHTQILVSQHSYGQLKKHFNTQ
jgi:hypothetical protein